MNAKFFFVNVSLLAAIIVPGAFGMQKSQSSPERLETAAVGTKTSDTELSDCSLDDLFEHELPFAEVMLSDDSLLHVPQEIIEKFLATDNFTLASGKQIIQANFRKFGRMYYEPDFERTLSWNLRILRYTLQQRDAAQKEITSVKQAIRAKALSGCLARQYENLREYVDSPLCPAKEAVVDIFAHIYMQCENVSREKALQMATVSHNFLTQQLPKLAATEYFSQKRWDTFAERNASFAIAFDKESHGHFFDAAHFVDFLEHGKRQDPVTRAPLHHVIFKKLYEIDFEKTIKWNLVLLQETKKAFDKMATDLELKSAEISNLETQRAERLQKSVLDPAENETLNEEISRVRGQETTMVQLQKGIFHLLGEQCIALERLALREACPAAVCASCALHVTDVLFDINSFEALTGANAWFELARQHVAPGMSPEDTAFYDFLCGQHALRAGDRTRAGEILKKIKPKFLSQKHNAQRDFMLAEIELRNLPARLTAEHYSSLVAIQTYLNRAFIESTLLTGEQLLSHTDMAILEEYRHRTEAFLTAVRGLR